jgi:hypothetical protein
METASGRTRLHICLLDASARLMRCKHSQMQS